MSRDFEADGQRIEAELRQKTKPQLDAMVKKLAGLPFRGYTVSWADAMTLVAEHPHYFSLTHSTEDGRLLSDPLWTCRFMAPHWVEVKDKSGPMAITLAFLKLRIFDAEHEQRRAEQEKLCEAAGLSIGSRPQAGGV